MENFLHVYVWNGVPRPWRVDFEFVRFEIFAGVEVDKGNYLFRVRSKDKTVKNNFIGISDEDYIIYKGVRYTNKTFNKLKMILDNETNLAALEEL